MTAEELLSELESVLAEAGRGPDDAYTREELEEILGLGESAVRRRLRAMKKAGRLQIVTVVRENVAGEPSRRPAYRILPAA